VATSQKRLRDPSERIARRLLAEGRITRDLHDAAMRHRQVTGQRFEESLLEVGLTEEQLLPLLAEMYRVQYVSTTKLAAAAIDKRTLALVPVQIAEHRQVIPVLLDRQRSVLSVVSSDPDDIETLKELELATQVRNIRVLVTRPAAVQAAIRKFYMQDEFAFAVLRNANFDVARALNREPNAVNYHESTLTERGLAVPVRDVRDVNAASLAPPASLGARQPSDPADAARLSVPPNSAARMRAPDVVIRDDLELQSPAPAPAPSGAPSRGQRSLSGQMPVVPARALSGQMPAVPARALSGQMPAVPARALSGQMPAVAPRRGTLTPPPPPRHRPPSPSEGDAPITLAPEPLESVAPDALHDAPEGESSTTPASSAAEETPAVPDGIGDSFQLAVVMVSLLEGNRRDLRGHSLQTARLVRSVCERFNLSTERTRAAELAALIHDFGKASSYHLTAYNVARYDGHHAVAQKLHATPARVVETAELTRAALDAVTHMYERYDGTGFPAGLKGNAIPLESRILAICDSYTDLTSNPRNSFRRVLTANEACEALRELLGAVFDPKVLDRFAHAVLGDDIAQRLTGDRGTILLVDPDLEETTVLELALLENLYAVRIARAADEALRFVESGEVDVLVSEMKLDSGTGMELLQKIRGAPGGESLPFLFLSEETDGAKVAAALDAGATDYLFKPVATQVLIAKLRRLFEQTRASRKVRGVSGSLEEMGIPDIVQILHQGRKTGALELSVEGDKGTIYFKDGAILDATWKSLRGEEAFYAVVGISKGDFLIDPSVPPPEKVIQASPEMLLLEGMRRMDEADR
jgi:response regulator RpfG family c-di-GMP phosphodiesterase